MKIKRLSHLIIGILFLLFAVVQFNDPDPWAWIAIYGLIAQISFFSAFGRYYKWAAYLILFISLIWMIFLFPGLSHWIRSEPFEALFGGMDPGRMHIEESREFLGLLMGVLSLLCLIVHNRRMG